MLTAKDVQVIGIGLKELFKISIFKVDNIRMLSLPVPQFPIIIKKKVPE